MVFHRSLDPIHMDLAGFKIIDAGQTFDQRRFPGTILSHKGVDLPLAQGEINIFQRLYARKRH